VHDFAAAGIEGWTMTHAFYADMGGFVLHTPEEEEFPPIPVDAKQLLFLIRNKMVERPEVDKMALDDKNKVDGLLRLITLFQVCWFAANTIGRAALGLAVTCLELTTSAFIICTLGTTYCWLHKPADVVISEKIYTTWTMEDIYLSAADEMGIEGAYKYSRTPLDILSRKEWAWSKYWSSWINNLRILHISFAPKSMPVDRFENTISLPLPFHLYLLFSAVTLAYCGVFVAGWNFEFPTVVEQYLWRIATLSLLGCCLAYAAVTHIVFDALPIIRAKITGWFHNHGIKNDPKNGHRTWAGRKIHYLADGIRNNTLGKDPLLTLPLLAILSIDALGFLYCVCRTYIFIADVIELRSLPSSAFVVVDWTNLLPNVH
jgi:hypothetical protein